MESKEKCKCLTEAEAYEIAYEIMRPLEGRCDPHLQQQLAYRIVRVLLIRNRVKLLNEQWKARQSRQEANAKASIERDRRAGCFDVLVEALEEARHQICYLHDKFQTTGSGEVTLARINSALNSAKNG